MPTIALRRRDNARGCVSSGMLPRTKQNKILKVYQKTLSGQIVQILKHYPSCNDLEFNNYTFR